MLRYKITDPKYYTKHPTKFFKRLSHSKQADFVSLRDKNNTKIRKLAKRFRFYPIKAKKIIHQDYKLAKRFGFQAVHLTGAQIDLISKLHRAGFFVIFSAHSSQEIQIARSFRADLITFSPIFHTPNKGRAQGIKRLRKALIGSKNIVALGGIVTKSETHLVKRTGCRAFASIRFFL